MGRVSRRGGRADGALLASSPAAEPGHAHRPHGGAGVRGLPQAEPAAHPAERRRAGGRGQREERGRPGCPRYRAGVRFGGGTAEPPSLRAAGCWLPPAGSGFARRCAPRSWGISPSEEPWLGVSRHPRRHPPCCEPISGGSGGPRALRARLRMLQAFPRHCQDGGQSGDCPRVPKRCAGWLLAL